MDDILENLPHNQKLIDIHRKELPRDALFGRYNVIVKILDDHGLDVSGLSVPNLKQLKEHICDWKKGDKNLSICGWMVKAVNYCIVQNNEYVDVDLFISKSDHNVFMSIGFLQIAIEYSKECTYFFSFNKEDLQEFCKDFGIKENLIHEN